MLKSMLKRIRIKILILVIIFLNVFVQKVLPETLVLRDTDKDVNLYGYMLVLEDKTGKITINDLISGKYETNFFPISKPVESFGFTNSVYWVKFRIKNLSSNPLWVIETFFTNMFYVDFYIVSDGKIVRREKTGILRPLSIRSIYYNRFSFPIFLKKGEEKEYYIRFQTESSMAIGVSIKRFPTFIKEAVKSSLFYGSYFGLILIFLVYSLFVGVTLRNRIYLHLIILLLGLLASTMTYSGIASMLLPSLIPYLIPIVFPLSLMLTLLGFLGTAEDMIFFKETPSKLWKIISIVAKILAGFTVFLVFTSTFSVVIRFISGFAVITIFTTIFLSIYYWSRKKTSMRVYILGFLVFIFSGLATFLFHRGVISMGSSVYAFMPGTAIFVILLSFAITEQVKELEKEKNNYLKEVLRSERKYRAIVENSVDLIWEADLYYEYTYVSPNVKEILGINEKDFLSKPLYFYLDEEEREKIINKLKETVKNQRKKMIVKYIMKDFRGKRRYFESRVSLFYENGNILSINGIERDITDEINMREQLIRAQKLEAVGTLAGGIAHEFNNLLTIIKGYSNMLLKSLSKEDKGRKYIEAIKRAGETGEALTKKVLSFSKEKISQFKTVELNSFLNELKEVIEKIIREDIEINFELTDDKLLVSIDPHQFEQVIINLVLNSQDAILEKGGGAKKITIKTEKIVSKEQLRSADVLIPEGSWALCKIIDSGIGMDEETKKRVFDPFFTTKEKGTGLGMSIVLNIIKKFGGKISIYSEKNMGTEIKIFLPIKSENSSSKSSLKNSKETYLGNKENIIVVEDNPEILELISSSLKQLNYNVFAFKDPQKAVEFVKDFKDKIHLLITDVVMKGMSGKQLNKKVKNILKDLKTIFISGYTGNYIKDKDIDENSVFIQKPFSIEELSQKVRELIEN